MAELYLVRHGQASLHDANYDQLSELGGIQSQLLGEHFARRDLEFDLAVTGTLERHKQTMASIASGMGVDLPITRHEGFNEYDFDRLLKAHADTFNNGIATIHRRDTDAKTFYAHLKKVLTLWSQDELTQGVPERWSDFKARINDALSLVQNSGAKRVLVVSSGGVIGAVAQSALQAPEPMAVELNLQVRNCSYSHYFFNQHTLKLSSFNNLPHLEQPSHTNKITYS